jgi:hypothetical protein
MSIPHKPLDPVAAIEGAIGIDRDIVARAA